MERVNLNEMEARELVAGFKGRFVHSQNMTFAFWEIEAGSSLPAHAHPHEQVVNILDGQMKFTLDGETQVLKTGDVVVVPPDLEHSGETVTACRVLDVFHPVREDYR